MIVAGDNNSGQCSIMHYRTSAATIMVLHPTLHDARTHTIIICRYNHGAPPYTIVTRRQYLLPDVHYAHTFHPVIPKRNENSKLFLMIRGSIGLFFYSNRDCDPEIVIMADSADPRQ